MKNLIFTIALAFVAAIFLGELPANAFSVKSFAQAQKGCIPKVSSERATQALNDYRFHASNSTGEETQSLGTALVWIEALNGGKPPESAVARSNSGYTFIFKSGFAHSHQAANEVVINRKGKHDYGKNVAQLVHELGHFLGNNGVYGEYRRAMQGHSCYVSSYGRSRFNEQFAEVFAAFVTDPTLIKNNSSTGCRLAYQFFSKQYFANGLLAERCATSALRSGIDY